MDSSEEGPFGRNNRNDRDAQPALHLLRPIPAPVVTWDSDFETGEESTGSVQKRRSSSNIKELSPRNFLDELSETDASSSCSEWARVELNDADEDKDEDEDKINEHERDDELDNVYTDNDDFIGRYEHLDTIDWSTDSSREASSEEKLSDDDELFGEDDIKHAGGANEKATHLHRRSVTSNNLSWNMSIKRQRVRAVLPRLKGPTASSSPSSSLGGHDTLPVPADASAVDDNHPLTPPFLLSDTDPASSSSSSSSSSFSRPSPVHCVPRCGADVLRWFDSLQSQLQRRRTEALLHRAKNEGADATHFPPAALSFSSASFPASSSSSPSLSSWSPAIAVDFFHARFHK